MITRRSYNIRCSYYKPTDENDNLSNLIYNKRRAGIFFAREADVERKSDITDAGVIDIEHRTLTIETQDDIRNIDHKDIVEFNGEFWIVEDIQRKIYNKTTQYDCRCSYIYWLTLRGTGVLITDIPKETEGSYEPTPGPGPGPEPGIYYYINTTLNNVEDDPQHENPETIKKDTTVYLFYRAKYGYLVPENITINGEVDSEWNPSQGMLTLRNAKSNIDISINGTVSSQKFIISTSLENAIEDEENVSEITINTSATLKFYPNPSESYKFFNAPSVTGADVDSWNSGTGILRISRPTDTVRINLKAIEKRTQTITATLSGNITSDQELPITVYEGDSVILTFSISGGYHFPANITINTNNYVWEAVNGKLTIEDIHNDINFAIEEEEDPIETYSITYNLTGIEIVGTRQDTIAAGGNATMHLVAQEGYKLPETITVTNASSSWQPATGFLPISNARGNITITAVGVEYEKLDTPIISFSINTRYINISSVPSAEGYQVYVDGVYKKSVSFSPIDTNTLDVTVGNHTIKVKAIADGYTDSDFSNQLSFTKLATLATPNVSIENDTLTIESVEHAEKYLVVLVYEGGSINFETTLTEINLADRISDPDTEYTVYVRAMATGYQESNKSEELTYQPVVINITYVLNHVTGDNPSTIIRGKNITLNFDESLGYMFPDNIEVTNVEDYIWNKDTGILYLSNPTDDVTITITGLPEGRKIIYNTPNVTPNPDNPEYALNNQETTFYFTADPGYVLPITVDIDAGKDWNPVTGELKIRTVGTENLTINIIGHQPTKIVNFTHQLSNCTVVGQLPSTLQEGATYEFTFNVADDYYFDPNDSAKIRITGASYVQTSTSTDKKQAKVRFTVEENNINLIVQATKIVKNFKITNAAFSSNDITIVKGGTTPLPGLFNLQYSFDEETWNNVVLNQPITLGIGDAVYFKGNNTQFSSILGYINITSTKSIWASGNIMSMLDETCESETVPNYCFYKLFYNNTNLVKFTGDLELPATTLGISCYESMFEGCTALTAAPGTVSRPALPARILANNCYRRMFKNCSSLTELAAINAVSTVSNSQACYEMYYGCSKIKMYTTSTVQHQRIYSIPTVNPIGEILKDMFTNTGGDFTGTPTGGTIYYTSNTVR